MKTANLFCFQIWDTAGKFERVDSSYVILNQHKQMITKKEFVKFQKYYKTV